MEWKLLRKNLILKDVLCVEVQKQLITELSIWKISFHSTFKNSGDKWEKS